MTDRFVTRGFVGRPHSADRGQRIPPGQYLTNDFPVLSAGPTPHTPLVDWSFRIEGLVKKPVSWTLGRVQRLPSREFVVDISCVTKWTKLDTRWHAVSVDTLLESVELEKNAAFVIAFSDGGYTTNLPIADVVNDQAFVAYGYDGAPLAPEHGGPARLVVPISTSGRAPSGFAACASWSATSPGSGSRSATTTAATLARRALQRRLMSLKSDEAP